MSMSQEESVSSFVYKSDKPVSEEDVREAKAAILQGLSPASPWHKYALEPYVSERQAEQLLTGQES